MPIKLLESCLATAPVVPEPKKGSKIRSPWLLEDNIIFLDSLEIKNHKTKELANKLNNFNFNTALFVYGDETINDNFKKASSNIPHVSILSCSGINVKDLISNHKIFIDEKSIDQITKRLSWK